MPSRTSANPVVIDPISTKRSRSNGILENLRIEIEAPSSVIGGITAFTRDPSGSRASTNGVLSSMRRPTPVTMRSIMRIR